MGDTTYGNCRSVFLCGGNPRRDCRIGAHVVFGLHRRIQTWHLDHGRPYSLCRNPLYVFSFLGSVGVGLSSETLLIPTIIGIAFVSYYPLVVRKEEEQLLKVHGEKYQAYLKSVPRFLPSFKGFVEPTDYVVKPTVFRRHLTSAVWFIWIPAAAEFVEMLHREAMIPSLFSIY